MLAATGIESRGALGAGVVALHVFVHREFVCTDTADHCFFIKLGFRPHLCCMSGCLFMAGEARVIFIAALEFNGDDVEAGMVMRASCLMIDGFAVDHCAVNEFCVLQF